MADEALPGDTFNVRLTAFVRLSTLIKPIMDNMYLDIHFWSVPCRLLWEHWKNLHGENVNPGDLGTSYLTPELVSPAGGYTVGSLHDYFGLPVSVAGIHHTALFHRGYNMIWNHWYRDENLQNAAAEYKTDSGDSYSDYVLLKRAKRPDYFTTCLPWTQKALTPVSVSLGTVAPVIAKDENIAMTNVFGSDNHSLIGTYDGLGNTDVRRDTPWSSPTGYLRFGGTTGLQTDISGQSITINSLRQAFQLQRLYERDARAGSRYIEVLRSHFGVVSPDARQQRPEYLGGGTITINASAVPQTSVTGATPQANLAAYGHGTSQCGFVKSFTEHCVIIGLASARVDLNYQQGLNRMWSRRTRWEYYYPGLAHLGEQAVLNKEIYCDGSGNDALTFGYQERWAEYRYKPSQITGKMRSYVSGTLGVWHLAQEFGSLPVLGDTFIKETPPISRVVATPAEPALLYDSHIEMKCARVMPVYSVPGLIDHF